MKKLTLYVASTVLYTSFIMILAVSAIFFLFTYISQAGDIGQGGYTAFNAFLYVLYDMPANLYLIMPKSSQRCLFLLFILIYRHSLNRGQIKEFCQCGWDYGGFIYYLVVLCWQF